MYVNVARLVMCCYLSCFAAPSPRASYSHISWLLATNLMVLYVFLAIHYIPIVSLSFSSFLHGFTPQLWLPLAAAFFFYVNSILFTSTTLLNIPVFSLFCFFLLRKKLFFVFGVMVYSTSCLGPHRLYKTPRFSVFFLVLPILKTSFF